MPDIVAFPADPETLHILRSWGKIKTTNLRDSEALRSTVRRKGKKW